MNVPRNLALAVLFVILAAVFSNASAIYIAQNTAGGNSGADCADAHSAAWFNSSANWGSGNGQIGPGTTAHLCGTFTGTAGATMLTVQGSGASGNPVIVKFETGAVLQAPYWGDNPFSVNAAAIVCTSGKSWITIDGGANGVIQNTGNGTGLANQHASAGIDLNACSHVEIKNITIKSLYVHKQDDGGGGNVVDIFTQDSDFVSIHDSTFTDAYQNINIGYSNAHSITNFNVYNNTIDHGCHFMQVGDSNNNSTASGINIYSNTLGPHQTEWTQAGAACHFDGIFMNAANSGSQLVSSAIFNNLVQSDMCNATTRDSNFNCSGLIYFAGSFNLIGVFNNVVVVTGVDSGYEALLLARPISTGQLTNFNIVNNTFIGNDSNQSCDCAGIKMNGANSGWVVENNIWKGVNPNTIYLNEQSTTTFRNIFGTSIKSNNYFDIGSNGDDYDNSQHYNTFTAWQTAAPNPNNFPGYDGNGIVGDPKLDSTYKIQSGSAAIGLATNLTSLCTGSLAPLCTDKAGVVRPQTGAWDAGAFQYSSNNPPTGLQALVQ